MENKYQFTKTDNQPIEIYKSHVDCYRGGDDLTTIYMKNGDVHYVKESFSEVDRLLDL